MEINRMLEIIIILITEGEVKAKDFAERFNCTTKTIYSFEYIKEAGIPITSENECNGGFKIGSGASKDKGWSSLKEQHTIINTFKNHGSIPEEQLEEEMITIEGLFEDNTADWIDVEFEDPKINKFFYELKSIIVNNILVKIYLKNEEEKSKEIRVKVEKFLIRNNGLYIVF